MTTISNRKPIVISNRFGQHIIDPSKVTFVKVEPTHFRLVVDREILYCIGVLIFFQDKSVTRVVIVEPDQHSLYRKLHQLLETLNSDRQLPSHNRIDK